MAEHRDDWFPIGCAPRDCTLLRLRFEDGSVRLAQSRLNLDTLPDEHPQRRADAWTIWKTDENGDTWPDPELGQAGVNP